jgi:hypothetical protein
MASKLESFLEEKKIDQRRLLNASRKLERLRLSDRRIKLTQTRARKSEEGKRPEGLEKPRSGRPVTPVCLATALAGGRVPGPAKTRLLRAVNHILIQRKEPPVALDALFDSTPGAVGAGASEE